MDHFQGSGRGLVIYLSAHIFLLKFHTYGILTAVVKISISFHSSSLFLTLSLVMDGTGEDMALWDS